MRRMTRLVLGLLVVSGVLAASAFAAAPQNTQAPTITDPMTGDGWVALDGDEGSDQCNFLFGTTDASGADVHLVGSDGQLLRPIPS